MSNPSLSGGGGITLDDVAVFLFNYSGVDTSAGSGVTYINSILDPDYSSAGGNDT